MQILVINQFAGTPTYSSGAGERFYYLAEQFKNQGHQTTVISGGYNHLFLKLPKTTKLFNTEPIPGGKFVWVKMRKYRGESFIGRLYSWFEFLLKLFRYRIDPTEIPNVVLVSSMSIFPIFYALRLRKKFNVKVILEVRDIWPLTPIELGGYSKRHPFIFLMSRIEKYAYKKADMLVSVLPGFSRHVTEVLGKEKEVIWIPNATTVKVEDKTGETGESAYPILEPTKFNVVYTGAMGIANALECIIEAADLLKNTPNICFSFIGAGPERNSLEEKAKELDLKNVTFFPKVKKSLVPQVLAQADACIISWRNRRIYSFGVSANKYNDYMLAGKPVISASNMGNDPVILSGSGINCRAESPESIAEAVLKIFEMPENDRKQMGKKGTDYVLNNQTYETISKKYIEVLDSCIKNTNEL